MSFPTSTYMSRETNPFAPDNSTPLLKRSTRHAIKSEWNRLADEETERLISIEEGLSRAHLRAAQIMATGTDYEKANLELYTSVSHYTNMLKWQEPRAAWVNGEKEVCAAFFKFLEAQTDPVVCAKAIEEMPVLPQQTHEYTREIQKARADYWLSLIP